MFHFFNFIMNNSINILALVFFLLFTTGCSTTTKNNTEELPDSANIAVLDTIPVSADSADSTQTKNESISGEVKEITTGKDGYTAKILTGDNKTYFATISHANLGENASQYRSVKVGETITVKGEVWKMGEEDHVTVRELK